MSVPGKVLLRPTVLADPPAVLDVQRACYPGDFLEDAATFTQRLQSPANLSCCHAGRGGVRLPCGVPLAAWAATPSERGF